MCDGGYDRLPQPHGRIPEGSSTPVEYDTVLNQLTGPESPFRDRVEELARERYEQRRAGTGEAAPAATA